MENEEKTDVIYWSCVVMVGILLLAGIASLQSCTLSFQNVMTSGEADGIAETDQDPQNTVSPDVTIPASVI